ncbi:phosphopantothenate--cysteine ligase CAB2 [Sporobolomyces salmoneus]|uniref:phosphopantothenate--cysteine ligase CAB2 n=1 Tax=Sporobolomyces salmoneus TaxID=183962 RepID=UPI00317D0D5D
MSSSSASTGQQFSAEEFFAQQPPPPRLDEILKGVGEFVERNVNNGKRVVLVTSGGTTVPLEHNVVRFLDNFSAGTRGASSAEHFLRTGEYAVIFLHRQHSLQPFSRHYSHSTNPFLALLDVVGSDGKVKHPTESLLDDSEEDLAGGLFPPISSVGTPATSPTLQTVGLPPLDGKFPMDHGWTVQVRPPHLAPMLKLLKSYKLVQSMGILHSIPFVTIDEYLWLLRGISRVMGETKDRDGKQVGRRGMYYLAAAVSDFFIPHTRMSEHKIQSGKGSLVIEMDQVPKVLKTMVDEWSNDGFIISFKLETDRNLIIPKARAALERYGHQIVIGNSLVERKHEVVFVEPHGEEWLRIREGEKGAGGQVKEIEEDIIRKLVGLHDRWIKDEQ